MLKRPHYIALGLVVVLTLTILNLPSQLTARMKMAVGSLFLPLFGLASYGEQLAGQASDALVPRRELAKQNDELRRANEELRLQAIKSKEIENENARLRELLHWQQQQPWKFKLAKVVLREPANWWRTLQIDLGSRDGARVNMPVLSGEGYLVGRISLVTLARSQVVLLGDPNCKVAARVENENHDTGVVGAAGPLDSEFVEMSYLSRNAILKPGQNVRTWGEGGIFPAQILIGRVVDSRPVEYGLSTVARVKLAANLNALEEVWVKFQ
jgi:rod shape-determining protein MreC